jgi:hypothetical protein
MNFSFNIKPTPVPVWLRPADSFYALRHGRVPLGCVCDGETKISITAHADSLPVVIRFLNDNRHTEQTVTLTNSNTHELQFNQTYVPFIDRPVGGEINTIVTGTVTNYTHLLPTYQHGESDEEEFKSEWMRTEAPFALIETNRAVILVPIIDRANVIEHLNMHQLNTHYTNVVTLYDKLIGVNPKADLITSTDATNHIRFFCKADAGGGGAAFYSVTWLGHSSNSVWPYLNIAGINWLVLHETGHAYDFIFVNSTPVLAEIWTNIMPDRFQHHTMSAEMRQQGSWVYDFGNRVQIENSIMSLLRERVPYPRWSFRNSLFMFTCLMNTPYGNAAFSTLNSQFRRLRSIDSLLHFFILEWWSVVAQDDILPFVMSMQNRIISMFTYWDSAIDNYMFTFERALAQFKRIGYAARLLIPDFDIATNNYGLQLENNFDLIYPRSTGLTSTVTILFDIEDFAQILRDSLSIYDGERLVFRGTVTARQMTTTLGVGVYMIHAPRGRQQRYRIEIPSNGFNDLGNSCTNLYLIVTNTATTHVNLVYRPITKPTVQTHRVGFVYGINYRFAAMFTVNTIDHTIELNVYRHFVHTISNRYFAIQLLTPDKNEIIDKLIVTGTTHSDNYYQFVRYIPGTVMRLVFYLQRTMNHIVFMSHRIGPIQTDYLLTEDDVQDLSNQNMINMQLQTQYRLRSYINFLNEYDRLLSIENFAKDEVYLMIKSLPDHKKLMHQYCSYLPVHFQCVYAENPPPSPPFIWNVWSLVILCVIVLIIIFIMTIIRFVVMGKDNLSTYRPIVTI